MSLILTTEPYQGQAGHGPTMLSHVDVPHQVPEVEGKVHIRHVAKVMPKPK